ncbi:hypothetical protein [Gryllotalpicola protaetiae]|nr:hypothetical protein [Gryllotalpicola protaetiae]
MTRDILDDLLDRSAPASPHVPAAEFRAMVGDARTAAPRPRRARAWLAGGMVVALLAGGTGVAYAATGGFRPPTRSKQPLIAMSFTMAYGFQCNYREAAYSLGPDPDPIWAQATTVLHNWYRSGDALVDTQALVPAERAWLPYGLTAGETVADLDTMPASQAESIEYDHESMAWAIAIDEAKDNELSSHGIDPYAVAQDPVSQLTCVDSNGQPYPKARG